MNSRQIASAKGWTLAETYKRQELAGFVRKRGRGAHDYTDEDVEKLAAVVIPK